MKCLRAWAVADMIVQRVVMPGGGSESWTVLDNHFAVVASAEAYLAYLAAIERSPNTLRAYASSIKLWLEFLEARAVAWDEVGVDSVAAFVAWLRAPAPNLIVIDQTASRRAESTVNRHLAAVFGFYDYHARSGVPAASALVAWRRVGRGAYKPFLHHVTRNRELPTRPLRLRAPQRRPRTLSPEEVVTLLGACVHLRDRFLIALLAESAIRVGQALGLRHADFVTRTRTLHVVPRADNANGARAKTRSRHELPISVPLARLYSDYMHAEYGTIDSDYVFVNLWSAPVGRPLRYQAVAGLVARLRSRTGIDFNLHMLRHGRATEWLRQGVSIEVVSKLLTHASVTTTSSTYAHLDAGDIRAELVRAGVWPGAGDGS